jgi:hypothetical protein
MLDLLLAEGMDLGFCCALFALILKSASYYRKKNTEIDENNHTERLRLELSELTKILGKGANDGSK